MSNNHITAGLTSLQQIVFNKPTQRFILWIIANDKEAFSIHFIIELTKQQELLQPGKSPNLAKALAIHQNLLKKKMINNGNPLKLQLHGGDNLTDFIRILFYTLYNNYNNSNYSNKYY